MAKKIKISVLTTIGNEKFPPNERQDKWVEAVSCYCDLADEVVVVNGGKRNSRETGILQTIDKVKQVMLPWPYEWNWVHAPKALNAGLEQCTGDWVIRLDIDQFIHEKDFKAVRQKLEDCPRDVDALTFQKMSMTYGGKYYQKGPVPIAFRNKDYIKIGEQIGKRTDLCFPVRFVKHKEVDGYELPCGTGLAQSKTGISYWNYDRFFKTKEVVKKELWRFSKAYHRYFKSWIFGETEEEAFQGFLNMMRGRHDRSPYDYTSNMHDHPKYIVEAVRGLKKEMFGHSAWGML